jgi:hypothetical protein
MDNNSDLGSGMGKIWIRDGKNSDPGWKKIGSGMEENRIRDGKKCGSGMKKIGSRMEKIWIREGKKSDPGSGIKHPGSATLLKNTLLDRRRQK